jgi:hypothetical protein
LPSSVAQTARLVCHPASCDEAVRAISVSARRAGAKELVLSYTIEADVAQLHVPPACVPRMGQDLWRHTCCECFIALKNEPAYHEYNFSPSGEWAAYAFLKYREGGALADASLRPQITVRKFQDRIELDAAIALERLSDRYRENVVMLALSAVIEDVEGGLSYWALAHPEGKPDFHRREAFTLELSPA